MAAPARFAGHGAIVTGASSGIGRAIALRLAGEGAAVLCLDLEEKPRGGSPDELPTVELITRVGGVAAHQACDASDEASVRQAWEEADQLPAPVGICVLNAGVFARDASILDETPEEHDHVMRVNERGVWLGLRESARRLASRGKGGRIICTASISGLVGMAAEPAYCASKAAVVNLVRAAALDLAPHRIAVNAVCPGFVATPMLEAKLADPAQRERLESLTPWPRLGTPDDIAAAVAFLASADADWITGTALVVDGGYTCR